MKRHLIGTLVLGLITVFAAAPARAQSPHFIDDFSSPELGSHWKVINPDPDAYIVENGKLLILNSTPADPSKENVPNLFVLDKGLPAGDCVMTTQVRADAQTMEENLFFGMYGDKNNYILAKAAFWKADFERNAACNLHTVKSSRGKISYFHRNAWYSKQRGSFVEQMKKFPNPFLLRLEKKGRSYTVSMKLHGDDAKWIEMEKLTSLRAKGQLAIGLYQNKQVQGESIVFIDWVKIESH